MKTKTVGTLLIAGLVVLSAMVVFTGTAYADTEILRPIGACSEKGITLASGCDAHSHWKCVDDASPDDNFTYVYLEYVYLNQGSERALYALSDPTGLCSGTINSVTAYIRIAKMATKMTDSGSEAKGAVSINTYGTTYDGNMNCPNPNQWTTYSKKWTTNPSTGSAWTWDDIKALEAGVKLTSGYDHRSRCTQVYVEVDYTPGQTTPIPEFSTIAIPIASILGLLFFFNHRKRRKEE